MYRNNRNMAMVSQFLGMVGFEYATQERVRFGYDDNKIDVLILRILTDGIQEVILPDKEEFRLVIGQHAFQDGYLRFVFVGHRYIMLVVYIHDMQGGFENVQHRFNRLQRG